MLLIKSWDINIESDKSIMATKQWSGYVATVLNIAKFLKISLHLLANLLKGVSVSWQITVKQFW